MDREDTAITLNEITSIDHLSYVLTELRNQESSDSALAYALDAQLQVLSIINSPKLSISFYDLMLDSLKTAIQRAGNQQEKEEYRRCAAIMTNSMVFFFDARLYWEKNTWNEQGIALLKNACNLVADSSTVLIAKTTKTPVVNNGLGNRMFYSLTSNTNGFFDDLIDWFIKGFRIDKYRSEFHNFLLQLFEKLERYRDIYGRQVLLCELIYRYKDTLAPLAGDKRAGLKRLLPNFRQRVSFLSVVVYPLLIGAIILLIGGIIFVIFNWFSGDKWLELFGKTVLFYPLFSFHFFLLNCNTLVKIGSIIVLLVLLLIATLFGNKYFTYIADRYFTEIAKLY